MPTLSKYHDEAITILKQQHAEVVCVIVVNGRKGTGCALTTTIHGLNPKGIADALHEIARQLESGKAPVPSILVDPKEGAN